MDPTGGPAMIRRRSPPPASPWVSAALAVALAYSLLSWQAHQDNPRNTTVPNAAQLYDGVCAIATPNTRTGEWLLGADAVATGRRFFIGMTLGLTASFLVGVAMGALTPVGAAFGPTLLFFGSIPPTAMLAVYYQVFGIGEGLYLGLIAVGVFPLLAGASV